MTHQTAEEKRNYRSRLANDFAKKSNSIDRCIGFPSGIEYIKPFVKVREGFGYLGVLSHDLKSGELQCHICGGWYEWLNNHIRMVHKQSIDEYREKFGLQKGTALVSDKIRMGLIKNARNQPYEKLQKRKNNIIKANKEKNHGNDKKKVSNKTCPETQNKLGVCKEQTLKKLLEICNSLDRQPLIKEMKWADGSSMVKVIKHRFGSILAAREEMFDHGYCYPGIKSGTYTKQQLVEDLTYFYKRNGRRPVISDFKRGFELCSATTYIRNFGSITNAIKEAFKND